MKAVALLAFLATSTRFAGADVFTLRGAAIVPGGGLSYGGDFSVFSTIGEANADTSAGGDFSVQSGFLPAVTGNVAPVAAPDVFTRGKNEDLKMKIAILTSNDFDPDLDPITFQFPATTDSGVPLVVSRGWIYYSHANPLPDSFTYTVTDLFGATATGRVDIQIEEPDAQSMYIYDVAQDASGAHLLFHGIANRAYHVEFLDSLEPGAIWHDGGVATDLGAGRFSFDDPTMSDSRFYRIVFRE